jgi:hypothetical protein
MFRAIVRSLVVAVILVAPTLGAAQAIEKNVAVLWIESLDAVIADAQRLMTLSGQGEVDRDDVLDMLEQSSDLPDLSMLDTSRPMVIVYPLEGMALGEKGLVAAFPVEDVDAALKAISERFTSTTVDDTGIHELSWGEESDSTVFVAPGDGYLVGGMSRDLVTRFDPTAVLEAADLPPGSIAIDVFLEPIAPMALMGLQVGRQAVVSEMQNPSESEDEEGAPDYDPDAAMAFVDLYFDFIRDSLQNASRIQMSLDVGTDAVVFHKHVMPRTGSTLAGLIEAQQGGLPEVARYVEPGDEFAAAAAQVTFTPEFTAAMQHYMNGYFAALQNLPAAAADSAGTGEYQAAMMKLLAKSSEGWIDCYAGDFAMTFGFHDDGGADLRQIMGIKDAEKCRALMTELAGMADKMGETAEGEPMITITENALEHAGVQGWRQNTQYMLPAGSENEAASAFLAEWFGDDGMVSYYGLAGDYMVSASGTDAETQFKTLVDRVTAKKKQRSRMVGITAKTFAPVTTGPGIFIAADLGRILDVVLENLPPEDEQGEAIREVLKNRPEGSGEIVEALRFEPGALHVEVAVRPAMIELIGRIMTVAETFEQEEDHEHPHDDDHGHGEHDEGHGPDPDLEGAGKQAG